MAAKSTEKHHEQVWETVARLLREHFRETAPETVIDRVDKLMAKPDEPPKPEKPGMVFYQGKWISPGDLPPGPTVRDEWAMVCPKCGKDDEIDVLASAYVRLTPDGPDASASHDGEYAWSIYSATKCCACGHTGIAREFGCQKGK